MQSEYHVNETRFKISADKFEIEDVRFEDEGVITCLAKNVFGVQEAKLKLTVLGEYVIIYFLPPLPNRTHKNDDIWARGPAKPPCHLFGFNKCTENNRDYRKNKCTKAGHENP